MPISSKFASPHQARRISLFIEGISRRGEIDKREKAEEKRETLLENGDIFYHPLRISGVRLRFLRADTPDGIKKRSIV